MYKEIELSPTVNKLLLFIVMVPALKKCNERYAASLQYLILECKRMSEFSILLKLLI
jgi:hypothetical protein